MACRVSSPENATRNPTRTARTAGALMIGLALVTLVATLGASLKGTNRGSLEDQVRADYVVTSDNGYDPFTSSAGKALEDAPGVAVASSVRSDSALAFGNEGTVTGVDPAAIGQVYDYRWNKGSDSVLLKLGFDGAVVRDDVADTENLAVGDDFSITTPQGKKVPLVVRGIYKPPSEQLDPLLGEVRSRSGRSTRTSRGRRTCSHSSTPTRASRAEPQRPSSARSPRSRTPCCTARRTGSMSVPVK